MIYDELHEILSELNLEHYKIVPKDYLTGKCFEIEMRHLSKLSQCVFTEAFLRDLKMFTKIDFKRSVKEMLFKIVTHRDENKTKAFEVQLARFKQSGNYYDSFEEIYTYPETISLYDLWDEIKKKHKDSEFIILVDVKNHIHNHPKLINLNKQEN